MAPALVSMNGSMTRAFLVLALAGSWLAASQAAAREPYDDHFFVKHGGSGAEMISTRAECRREAVSISSASSSYSDPNYGALAAMGAALDSDQLHNGGIQRRMEIAVLNNCMGRSGWTPLEPTRDEAKAVSKANLKRPEALDAWIKAHEPPAPKPPEPPKAVATATPTPSPTSATPPKQP